MPQTEQLVPDRQHLVRYLLDLLPEEEAERLDLASITDDQIASHLRVIECDLVDDYVLGSLTGETLQQFEARYLTSTRRRDNVKMAARFLDAVERAAAQNEAPGAGVPGARVLLSAAAALVIAAGGAFMFRSAEPSLPESTVQTLPAQPRTDESPEREAVGRTPVPGPVGTQNQAAARGSVARRDPGVAALVLWPQTRSAGPLPTLLIPAGRASVVLQLTLESTPFAQYRAGLKNPADNEIVWRSGWLIPTTSGSRTSVRIVVPTVKMRPQHYSIELSGRSPDSTSEVVESYTFRVGSR